MKSKIAGFFKSLALLAAPLVLASCFSGIAYEEDGQTTKSSAGKQAVDALHMRTANERKGWPQYKVATLEYFPPFVIRDELRNSTGFDVEILSAIGQEEKFVPVFVPIRWSEAFTSLDSGSRHILASGISILPERELNYDFSDPYLTSSFSALCIEKPGAARYANFAEIISDKSLTFVTQKNSAGSVKLAQLLDGDMDRVLQVDTQYDEVRQVIKGNADAAFDISRVMSFYINRFPASKLYLVTDPSVKIDNLGFVVKKGNTELQEKLNRGLQKIKSDGTYDRIYRKWFGYAEL